MSMCNNTLDVRGFDLSQTTGGEVKCRVGCQKSDDTTIYEYNESSKIEIGTVIFGNACFPYDVG